MVRLPPSWPVSAFHHPGGSGPARPPQLRTIPRIDPRLETRPVTDVPLQPAQAQAIVPGSGTVTLPSLGPTGMGNIWYPAQATSNTTTGAFDTAILTLYLGPVGIPVTQVGSCLAGSGTIALALPPMQPGQYLIGVLTGGHTGDLVTLNVVGVMDALAQW